MGSDGKSSKNIDTLANGLANTLAERIHRDTIEKDLSEGDFFMTVEQISEHYEVSRTIAREAVSQLRALGILQSRQRKGLLIGRPDPVKLMSRWLPFYGQGNQGNELLFLGQLRYSLEIGAVDIAVAQGTEKQIKQILETAEQFDKVGSKHGHNHEADLLDLAFHRLILEMTSNPLITGMHRILSDYFHASQFEGSPPEASKAIREHYLIADALKRRDNEAARNLLRCHLEIAITNRNLLIGKQSTGATKKKKKKK